MAAAPDCILRDPARCGGRVSTSIAPTRPTLTSNPYEELLLSIFYSRSLHSFKPHREEQDSHLTRNGFAARSSQSCLPSPIADACNGEDVKASREIRNLKGTAPSSRG